MKLSPKGAGEPPGSLRRLQYCVELSAARSLTQPPLSDASPFGRASGRRLLPGRTMAHCLGGRALTVLRTRMIEGLQRRGGSARTQALDVRAGRQLAEPARHSPALLPQEERRPDCLALTHVKPYARRASTSALGGLQVFFAQPLPQAWLPRRCVRAPREKKLPGCLSLDEVRTRLGRVHVRSDRAC
jgi:hypothetical protein